MSNYVELRVSLSSPDGTGCQSVSAIGSVFATTCNGVMQLQLALSNYRLARMVESARLAEKNILYVCKALVT